MVQASGDGLGKVLRARLEIDDDGGQLGIGESAGGEVVDTGTGLSHAMESGFGPCVESPVVRVGVSRAAVSLAQGRVPSTGCGAQVPGAVLMADAEDVRRLAKALPHVEEIASAGFDFRVGGKGFVWSYPEREPGKPRVIRTDIAVLFVGDEDEKQALLLGEPDLFFTAPGYRDQPLVMLRLARVGVERLTELITDAWRMRAPDGLLDGLDDAGQAPDPGPG